MHPWVFLCFFLSQNSTGMCKKLLPSYLEPSVLPTFILCNLPKISMKI